MPPAAPEFRMALLELLRQYQGDRALDVLREGVRLLAEALMELEVSEQVGAGRYERTPELLPEPAGAPPAGGAGAGERGAGGVPERG
jgi:hypothetical protein